MNIDLRSLIKDESAIKSGGFTGAIFLTYTLNLTFYEQMIAPALDQAGCSNVLILVDPDGYNAAMEMGAKTVTGAGMRYVSAPVLRQGMGVQHSKLLLMAGPKRGRMFIGSGNLTLHGFGRNLELFSHFEVEPLDSKPEDLYPFARAWNLIRSLTDSIDLPIAAQSQIKVLGESAPWLSDNPSEPVDFFIWHNFEQSIWEQLENWRSRRGWTGTPIREFRVISPYYDRDMHTLCRLADAFLPERIHLHLDPAFTNMNGDRASRAWMGRETAIQISGIVSGQETSKIRHVHAKAIIGLEQNGTWCIIGSANLTRPALQRSWINGGNLELVNFRWSPDPGAFDYLFHDSSVRLWPLNFSDVADTEVEPSERPIHFEVPFLLTDLSVRGENLTGRLSNIPLKQNGKANLRFLRTNRIIPIHLEQDSLSFQVRLPTPLTEAEAARFETGELATPYRWIDQPEVLAKFGARTYHVRIKGKLETILGAEQLFQELMNFLWERADPHNEEDRDPHIQRRRRRSVPGGRPDLPDGPPPPDPEGFITDEELVRTLHWGVEHHQPYDRSLMSLRDLLSLVLLRLTTPTQAEPVLGDDDTRDEEEEQKRQADQEAHQVKILERLRNYLLGYCKKYGRLLTEPGFLTQKSPDVIFQNHFTLGRVLLEFSARADHVFTRKDLVNCFWYIWGPLVWPEIVGLEGLPALKILERGEYRERFKDAWQKNGMPAISVMMIKEVLGQPPGWKAALWDKQRVGVFLVARDWIARIIRLIGEDAFQINQADLDDTRGLRSVSDLTDPSPQIELADLEQYKDCLSRIRYYLPPVEEKLSLLIRLYALDKEGKGTSQQAQELIEEIHKQGLSNEYKDYISRRAPILPVFEDDLYCPRCGARLIVIAENSIKQGRLVLCTSSRDAWIYLRPRVPKIVI